MTYNISEEDKVCTNCKQAIHINSTCMSALPCKNKTFGCHANQFEPSNDYLKKTFKCEACRFDINNSSSDINKCYSCSKFYDDMWEAEIV